MAIQTNIPDLSDGEKGLVETLDVYLNQILLFAFLQGIYTGIVAFTLWRIFSRGRGVGINAMALVIIVLCILTATTFAFYWSLIDYSFIHHGQNLLTLNMAFDSHSDMTTLVRVGTGIVGCISIAVADSTMVWRCWIVWGRRWIVILLPLVFTVLGTIFKVLQIRATVQGTVPAVKYEVCTTIYTSLTLATTLLCTLLIVYRILSIEWTKQKLEGTRTYSLGAYRNVIEIMVESAALYSATLIVYMVFTLHDEVHRGYIDSILEFTRGAAPTLLVGRVASGHSRPDDSWKGSVVSSLEFGTCQPTQTGTETSTEEDLMHNDDSVHNVELLAGQSDGESVNVGHHMGLELVANKGV